MGSGKQIANDDYMILAYSISIDDRLLVIRGTTTDYNSLNSVHLSCLLLVCFHLFDIFELLSGEIVSG
jgi:hypothetical protein